MKLNLPLFTILLVAVLLLPDHRSYAQIINTIAGNGIPGYSGDGGAATAAQFSRVTNLTVDNSGNVFVIDYGNNCVRKINSATGIISTYAGIGVAGFSGDGGPATAAMFDHPSGIIVDKYGDLIIADQYNQRIRKVNAMGIVTTIAGTGTFGTTGDGGPATAANLYYPTRLAVDSSNNIYIACAPGHVVRKINAAGIISTFAGDGTYAHGGDGGPATAAQISGPLGMCVDSLQNVYICELNNNCVRKVSSSGIISTIVGIPTFLPSGGYGGDGGPATAALLSYVYDIKELQGKLYISDNHNNSIRMVNETGIISTVNADTNAGFSGDGGPVALAHMRQPFGLAIKNNTIYVGDDGNFRVRKFSVCDLPVAGTITGTDTLCTGISISLAASSSAGSWSSDNLSVASVTAAGIVTGLTSGAVTIRYIVANSCGADTALLPLYVNNSVQAGTISGEDTICIGTATTLTVSVPSGSWGSVNSLVATVSGSGVVTGIAGGTDTIVYVVNNSCSIDTAFFDVYIKNSIECGDGVLHLQNDNHYTVFPNPANDQITISNAGINPGVELSVNIYNVVGKRVDQFTYQSLDGALLIDIARLTPGLYNIVIKHPDGLVYRSRFTKAE